MFDKIGEVIRERRVGSSTLFYVAGYFRYDFVKVQKQYTMYDSMISGNRIEENLNILEQVYRSKDEALLGMNRKVHREKKCKCEIKPVLSYAWICDDIEFSKNGAFFNVFFCPDCKLIIGLGAENPSAQGRMKFFLGHPIHGLTKLDESKFQTNPAPIKIKVNLPALRNST